MEILVNLISGTSSEWGSPLTLETGREIFGDALVCMESVLKPDFRHGYNETAFQNLAKQPNQNSIAVIAGHGKPGAICTGEGDHCNSFTTVMSKFTQPHWATSAQGVRHQFKALRLLGCDIGADQIGADFLFEMAKELNIPVTAPTYLVWCGSGKVYLDPLAKWLIATPDHKPDPIASPTVSIQGSRFLQLRTNGKMTLFTSGNFRVIAFQYSLEKLESNFRSLNLTTAEELVRFVDFEHPIESDAVPLAVATGYFTLQLRADGENRNRHFKLYNDELVQDLDTKGVYYRVDSRLKEHLASARLK